MKVAMTDILIRKAQEGGPEEWKRYYKWAVGKSVEDLNKAIEAIDAGNPARARQLVDWVVRNLHSFVMTT